MKNTIYSPCITVKVRIKTYISTCTSNEITYFDKNSLECEFVF